MLPDPSFCDIIRKIKQNPLAKVEGITIGKFAALQEHLKTCVECSTAVNEVLEEYKDIPIDYDDDWGKTKYN